MQKTSFLLLSILIGLSVLISSCNKKEPVSKPPEFITDPAELLKPAVKTREVHLREIRDYIKLEYSGSIFDKKQRELWEEKTGGEASLFAVHGEVKPTVVKSYSIKEKKSSDGKDVVDVRYEILGHMDLPTRFKPDPRLYSFEFPILRGAGISIYSGGIYVSREYIENKLAKNVDDEGELDYESKVSLEDIKKVGRIYDSIIRNPGLRQAILDESFGKKINVRRLYKISDIISKAREEKDFDIQSQDITLYEFLEKYTHSSNLEKLKQAFIERNGESLSEIDKNNIEIIEDILEWVRLREMAG